MTNEAEKYDFAVYGTQGGGLVRWVNGAYVFIERPKDFPELTVGSFMPSEWDIIPANDAAHMEINEAEDFNRGLNDFFDVAFEKVERGEMSLKQIGKFLDIANRK